MSRVILATINLILGVLAFILIAWFDEQETKIEALNKKHEQEILKIKKVTQVNGWLKGSLAPMAVSQQASLEDGALNLVRFYDDYTQKYNIKLEKYFYEDGVMQKMDLAYKVDANDSKTLKELTKMDYPHGFLQFTELKSNQDSITGKIQLIQPHNGSK